MRWVHATLVETAVVAHDLVLPPLPGERYWKEARLFAALFGIPPTDLPPDWQSFAVYNEAMAEPGVLAVDSPARDIVERLFLRPATGLHPTKWYQEVTARMLPERVRGVRISSGNANIAAPAALCADTARLSASHRSATHCRPLSGSACPPERKVAARHSHAMA